jgi:IS4 transposase
MARCTLPLRETLRKLFPSKRLNTLARETGAVKRRRKVKIVELFWTLVLGFGVGRERTIAGLRRSYEKTLGETLSASSFYDRFTPELVQMLKKAVAEALPQVRLGVSRSLEGPLKGFEDVLMTDSTAVRLHELLAESYPASRTNHTQAALKMHTIMSVRGVGKQSVKLTAERVHDGPVLVVGPWVQGHLFLFDLGYFRYRLFEAITRHKGFFISRLKSNVNPTIVALHRPVAPGTPAVIGRKLQDAVQSLQGEVLDVTVEVVFQRRAYAGHRHRDRQLLRVVGVWDQESETYHLYLTNIPSEKLTAEDIALIYALRWEIELLFKELKQHYRLEDMPSRQQEVVEALLYAALLTLIVSRRLLALLRQALGEKAARVKAHRWATVLVSIAQELLLLVIRPPREIETLLRRLIPFVLHEAIDPNKRRLGLLASIETRTHSYRTQTV